MGASNLHIEIDAHNYKTGISYPLNPRTKPKDFSKGPIRVGGVTWPVESDSLNSEVSHSLPLTNVDEPK